MPITYVLKVPVPGDQTIQQYKETLEKRLSTLKPKRLNKYHVQMIVYQTLANQNVINQFLHSDYPATCFSIYETAAGGAAPSSANTETKCLTGDIGLASINRRISETGFMTEKKAAQIECMGSALKIGDFQVKIGAVTHSSSNRGLLIECSYSSANTNQDAYGVINEFIQSFFGWTLNNEMLANHVRQRPKNMIYTPEDTIIQYFEHFNNLRNAPSSQSSRAN